MTAVDRADMRIEIVKRELKQGALSGLGSEVTDYAAGLVIAALDSYDQHVLAAERARIKRSLSIAVLAALRSIPDGEIRNGCVVHDGAQVRERLRSAWLSITGEDVAGPTDGRPSDHPISTAMEAPASGPASR